MVEWDPLLSSITVEAALADEMQRQSIRNILGSYTGFYDLFSELIQNALDACDLRAQTLEENYSPQIWLHIDIQNQEVSILDNGIGMDKDQLRLFLQPNMTFKKKRGATRGNKGVGATFLAYGFNHMTVATKVDNFKYAGAIENGRLWAEDTENSRVKPRMHSLDKEQAHLETVDRGTYFKIKLTGLNIKPKNLNWIQASNAQQWDVVLRAKTPLGGLYFSSDTKPKTKCYLKVTSAQGESTEKEIEACEYFYPHEMTGVRFISLGQLISERKKAVEAGKRADHLYRLHGIYDLFAAEEIMSEESLIKPNFSEHQLELMKIHKPDVYVFFGYSTQLWDNFNDNVVALRAKGRILRGGLQLATQYMAQGEVLVIPLTKSIGYQNQTHVIVHFRNAEPDLGRKGFQPELVALAELISTSSVTTFKKYVEFLRKDGGEPLLTADAEKYNWIREQETWAENNPLSISGAGLFAPEEIIPIQSAPLLEQDVVALFNQLLAGGVIRGFRILSTSGNQRYDGVYKVRISAEKKYIYHPTTNPLGIPAENVTSDTVSEPKILEYKYNLDALIADFEREDKYERHVDLIVAWTIGERWSERYQVNPLLHKSFLHRRHFHGVTHDFLHYTSGEHVFYGIILDELIEYLQNPEGIQEKVRTKYIDY